MCGTDGVISTRTGHRGGVSVPYSAYGIVSEKSVGKTVGIFLLKLTKQKEFWSTETKLAKMVCLEMELNTSFPSVPPTMKRKSLKMAAQNADFAVHIEQRSRSVHESLFASYCVTRVSRSPCGVRPPENGDKRKNKIIITDLLKWKVYSRKNQPKKTEP